MDRARLIGELLNYERSVQDVLAGLSTYGWDSDEPLRELKPSHVRHALHRFVLAELSAAQVEEWANAIECRDDIAYEPSSLEGDTIFELANPELTQQLDLARAKQLLQLLSVDP
jgi:hypothetical protein